MSWCQKSSLCYTRLHLNMEKRNVVFQLMFSRVLYCCLEFKPANPFFFFLTFWNRHLLKEESSSGRAAPQSCFFRKNVIFNHQQWLWVCVSVLPLERQKPVWQKYYQLLLQSLAKSFAFWSERRDWTRNLFIKQASNIGNTQLLQNLHRVVDNDYLSAWMYYTLSNLIISCVLSRVIFLLSSLA